MDKRARISPLWEIVYYSDTCIVYLAVRETGNIPRMREQWCPGRFFPPPQKTAWERGYDKYTVRGGMRQRARTCKKQYTACRDAGIRPRLAAGKTGMVGRYACTGAGLFSFRILSITCSLTRALSKTAL